MILLFLNFTEIFFGEGTVMTISKRPQVIHIPRLQERPVGENRSYKLLTELHGNSRDGRWILRKSRLNKHSSYKEDSSI